MCLLVLLLCRLESWQPCDTTSRRARAAPQREETNFAHM